MSGVHFEQEIQSLDQELASARDELRDAEHRIDELEDELRDAEHRIDDLENDRTEPLNEAVRAGFGLKDGELVEQRLRAQLTRAGQRQGESVWHDVARIMDSLEDYAQRQIGGGAL